MVLISVLQLFSFSHPYLHLSLPISFPNHYECFSQFHHLFLSLSFFHLHEVWLFKNNSALSSLSLSLTQKKRQFLYSLPSASLYHVGHTSSTSPIAMPPFSAIYSHYHSFHHSSPLPPPLTITPFFHYSFLLCVLSLCSSPGYTLS